MARILLYDIESSPNLAHVWALWQTDVVAVEVDWQILCFAWKWLGESKVHSLSLPELKNPRSDRGLAVALHDLFDEADVVVAHNGNRFDQPKARTRMLVHGLDPPSPFREVDTLQVARRHFSFASNKLDELARQLGVSRKAAVHGFSTWKGCMENDPRSWATMVKYCKQDVRVLEDVYLKLRPWMPRHPNIGSLDNEPDVCPACGSKNLIKKGKAFTDRAFRQRYRCTACGHWCCGREQAKSLATRV